MSREITNFEIEIIFKEMNNADINDNFLGVFPSDKIKKFVMFEKMMPEKKYSFIISNIDRQDQPGEH